MRPRLQRKIAAQAKQTIEQFNQELESSQYAVTLKKKDFTTPPMFATKDLRQQLLEANGKVEFEKDLYHNQKYNNLMKQLIVYRREFPKMKDIEGRKQMAKEEFDLWNSYLQERKADTPKPDYEIDQKDFSMIKENFDRFKDRKTHRVKSEDMTDFHHDYAKKFKFRVPLHPKNLQQMIHPHFGYLASFKNRAFTFEELTEIYQNQIVSSYERAIGQEILADELACLGYWLIEDEKKKGFFSLQEVKPLLEALRFETNHHNLSSFKKEFKFTLSQNPGEIRNDLKEEEVIIRFDLIRQIFLERGL